MAPAPNAIKAPDGEQKNLFTNPPFSVNEYILSQHPANTLEHGRTKGGHGTKEEFLHYIRNVQPPTIYSIAREDAPRHTEG